MEKEEDKILKKDTKEYKKFEQALKVAEHDGRLNGEFICHVCGMRHWTRKEADECCLPAEE
ncbi:MAG: hypothetical protein WC528_05460 [Patescibacteria group bacterium]